MSQARPTTLTIKVSLGESHDPAQLADWRRLWDLLLAPRAELGSRGEIAAPDRLAS